MPLIVYNNRLTDCKLLFNKLTEKLTEKIKSQLIAEIIFSTHNEKLKDIDLQWQQKVGELLWKPELQETKLSDNGSTNMRYKSGYKGSSVKGFTELFNAKLP